MTKSILCAVFIILILGVMANEIQGNKCGEVLPQVDCGGGGACGALCRQLKHGIPQCLPTSNGKLACYCTYLCPP
ncbi:unnamed protein product [Eruca vesicaria subsp. sativa]|uniref:Defensin-like protein n=1 Tax=Eruca vesicaria subsp. sativa TaxID=29727 RepID=A0ABC8M805_ERUVS|nr:unnamed protein product [Eruca vesicaria subsp. sativa]